MVTLLKTFRERNYRLFFIGQGLSLIGYWIQSTTFNWLLYQLTDSALWLGYFSAAIYLPVLVLLPLAGSLVDRFDCRRLLLGLQLLFMFQALALTVLTHFDLLTLSLIVTMGGLQSVGPQSGNEPGESAGGNFPEFHAVQQRPCDGATDRRLCHGANRPRALLPAQRSQLSVHAGRIAAHAVKHAACIGETPAAARRCR